MKEKECEFCSRDTGGMGRGMYATRRLKAGETILEELPLMVIGKTRVLCLPARQPCHTQAEGRRDHSGGAAPYGHR